VSEKSKLELSEILQYASDGMDIKNRIFTLDREIKLGEFHRVNFFLNIMNENPEEAVTFRINSEGGSMTETLAIVGVLKNSACIIITECYGEACSGASLILACGNLRRASKFSSIMHHECSYKSKGRDSSVKAAVENADRDWKRWCGYLAEFSNQPAEFWYSTGRGIDFWMTPEKALELGLIDEVF
jgi:ATP-dependent Clp protease protease subunit